MKKLLLATTVAFWALAGPAGAIEFTQSDFAGTGNFGTITAQFTDATDTIVEVNVNMAPNVILDTGSHFALTISAEGTGRISQASLTALNPGETFTAQTHVTATTSSGYSNPPFTFWNDAIAGACGSGGSSGGCGSTLSFLVTGFQGFDFATNTFNGFQIAAAADVLLANCTGGCTGAVGATGALIPTPFVAPVPGPIVGAGLPGLVAGCFGLLGLGKYRRRRQGLAV